MAEVDRNTYGFGRGKWVFVDWLGIEPGYGKPNEIFGGADARDGFLVPEGIRLHVPLAHPEAEPVIRPDSPWDDVSTGSYASFIQDGDRFCCWYEAYHSNEDGKTASRLAYAESADGTIWRKPHLGLVDFRGSRDNALIDLGERGWAHGPGVFKDANPDCPPEAYYKLVSCGCDPEKSIATAVSADGLRWQWVAPILKGNASDTQNIGWYNMATERYVLYTRQGDSFYQRRGVSRSESETFSEFPPTQPVFETVPGFPPDRDIYCNSYHQWPGADHAHIMLLSVYCRTSDLMEIHLAVSRDERHWHFPLGTQPWLVVPEWPSPPGGLYATNGLLPTGDGEWSHYVAFHTASHNEGNVTACFNGQGNGYRRVPIREDGFTCLRAEAHGRFATIPFTLQSRQIHLNARVDNGGYIRCEILEGGSGFTGGGALAGAPVTGYTLDECQAIVDTTARAPLTWNSGTDLSALRGRQVRLCFSMFKADLHAIVF